MIQMKQLLSLVLLLLQNVNSTTATRNIRRNRQLTNRVSELDKDDATCIASLPEDEVLPVELINIKYYYAVESDDTVGIQTLWDLERNLFYAIGYGILWCSQSNGPAAQSNDNGRMLFEELPNYLHFEESHRKLSINEARRLGILSFNSAPSDVFLPSETCVHDFIGDKCVITEGKMALMAHQSDNLDIIISSILDSVQKAMDDDVLILSKPCSGEMCTINKVRWLGTTIEEARAGGPSTSDDDDGKFPMLAYAAIPIAFLLGLSYLLAKRKKRRAMTPAQLALEEDYILVGTGDPPRHFHEGMYHYTRSGARYLSTNCPDCHETRKLGFSTDGDLPTIAEGRLYDPRFGRRHGPRDDDISGDLSEVSSYDASTYRKLYHVPPSEGNLGVKHSSIDVHQCTSTTCRICSYRPKDAIFVPTPKAALSPRHGIV